MCVPAFADMTCFVRFDLYVCMRDAPPGGKEIDQVLTDGRQASWIGNFVMQASGLQTSQRADGRCTTETGKYDGMMG